MKLSTLFKRSSETPAPVEAPVINKGIPRYARMHAHRRNDAPTYEQTAEFLERDPLDGIKVGELARPEGAALEAPAWGVDDWLDGQYESFPWHPEDDEILPEDEGVIINEERL